MSVLKPKPVTTGKNQKTLNQSEIEANKVNGFDVTSDWLRKTHEIFLTNQRAIPKQTQITFGIHLKIKRFKTTLTLSHRAFFDPLGPGVYSEAPPPHVTVKPLTLWPPNLHSIVYALILINTDTVTSL